MATALATIRIKTSDTIGVIGAEFRLAEDHDRRPSPTEVSALGFLKTPIMVSRRNESQLNRFTRR